MATRKQKLVQGEYFHLYNRGVEKRKIFMDASDYHHFLWLMFLCNTDKSIIIRNIAKKFDREKIIVEIGSYCLMPNHFHILIKGISGKSISRYMEKLLTAYSMYFNKKYKRTGHLFEGTYKAVHVKNNRYLKYLYTYIHLNPAKLIDKNWKNKKERTKSKNELLAYVLKYQYSSIREYTKTNVGYKILSSNSFPQYFKSFLDHKKELFEWLSFETT